MQLTVSDINEMVKGVLMGILNEDVFIQAPDENAMKKHELQLAYNNTGSRNRGKLAKSQDILKTDKMDNDSSDTYVVPLKNGIMSYNITSIKGLDIMHYFKKLWDHEKAKVKVFNGKKDSRGEEYELTMLQSEFDRFMNQFIRKVSIVVGDALMKFTNENRDLEIDKIAIYPVPSSSNFNYEMARKLKGMTLLNLPVQVINQSLLVKDIRNLQRDEDFIKKNQDYYNGKLYAYTTSSTETDLTVNDKLNKRLSSSLINRDIERSKSIKYVEQMNQLRSTILQYASILNSRYAGKETVNDPERIKLITSIASKYSTYCELYFAAKKELGTYFKGAIEPIKWSREPSAQRNTENVNNILKYAVKHKYVPKMECKPVSLYQWKTNGFQIKSLSNGERMGLKNYYSVNNWNQRLVERELEKTKNSALVIFDDNISGGATLSDICDQLTSLGVKNIIPITFGKMDVKWHEGLGTKIYNQPEGGFNY